MTTWVDRLETFATREAWLTARGQSIGGSDVPVILGLSPWATPLQLWARKVGLEPPDAETLAMRLGHHMEEFIADEFCRETGLAYELFDDALLYHPDHRELHYSPDGVVGPKGGDEFDLFEAKNRTHFAAAEWGEDVPRDVWAQVQHGLDCTGARYAYVAALVGRELRWAKVPRDNDWIEETRPRLLAFAELVRTETQPEAAAGDREVLDRLYPAEEPGKAVALPPEALDWHEMLLDLAARRKPLEAQEDALKARIRQALGDAEVGILPAGAGAYTCKTQHRKAYMVEAKDSRVMRYTKKVK